MSPVILMKMINLYLSSWFLISSLNTKIEFSHKLYSLDLDSFSTKPFNLIFTKTTLVCMYVCITGEIMILCLLCRLLRCKVPFWWSFMHNSTKKNQISFRYTRNWRRVKIHCYIECWLYVRASYIVKVSIVSWLTLHYYLRKWKWAP